MAGPPVRERYNAKARGSTAGGSHKKRKRVKDKQAEGSDNDASAVPTIVDVDAEARGKMSSKKRKRMDSYIVRVYPTSSCAMLTMTEQKAEDG